MKVAHRGADLLIRDLHRLVHHTRHHLEGQRSHRLRQEPVGDAVGVLDLHRVPSFERPRELGRAGRLDGHDAAVPEEVWELLASVLPRCPNARGVTLERMEGTVGEADVPLLREELARARRIARGARRAHV